MTEELIIDGRAVDMDSRTAVTLNFKSNLLGDISKITASNSQTISLPKTTRNREILDDPTAPSRDSSFRYVRHDAKYRRNGVEVIPEAYAVLLDCADSYEVAIYWGVLVRLQSWLDSGLRLSDLGWEPSEGTVTWGKDNSTSAVYIWQDYKGFVWADYDCGIGDRTALQSMDVRIALHPFVQAYQLLGRIAEDIGLTEWNIPDTVMQELCRTAVLLTTNYTEEVSQTGTISQGAVTEDPYIGNTTFQCYVTVESTEAFTVTQGSGMTLVEFLRSGTMTYTVRASIRFGRQLDARAYAASCYLAVPGGQLYGTYAEEDGNWYAVFSGSVTAEVSSGQSGYFAQVFVPATGLDWPNQPLQGDRFDVVFTPDDSDATALNLGDTFPASPNMPDITQVDFVKGMCEMYGMFVMPCGDGGLQFCTLEALTGNRANAVDWSDRLVPSGVAGEPTRTAFTFGDYARHNWFRYKEDDTVTLDGDGDLQVRNQGLDYEREALTLPFAPSDSHDIEAGLGGLGVTVPHYEWDDEEEGTVKRKEVKPRVVRLSATGNGLYSIATFERNYSDYGIRWPDLLANWHGGLSSLLDSCVAIEEDFRLDEYDLMGLDYTRPVYLRQYGRYYGIVSIQTKDGGLCRAELVQLPL